MRWETRLKAQKAADKGTLAALDSSIRHWHNFQECTLEQLLRAHDHGWTAVGASWCALCMRASGSCKDCPIYIIHNCTCQTTSFPKASRLFWKIALRDFPELWPDFQKAAKEEEEFLREVKERYLLLERKKHELSGKTRQQR